MSSGMPNQTVLNITAFGKDFRFSWGEKKNASNFKVKRFSIKRVGNTLALTERGLSKGFPYFPWNYKDIA